MKCVCVQDDGDRMLLHLDFEIGQTIRDTIVPHALFHYTGECDVDDDDDFDDEEVITRRSGDPFYPLVVGDPGVRQLLPSYE